MYVKEHFKSEPSAFNPTDMNIKILYKEKFEKDMKHREKAGFDDEPDISEHTNIGNSLSLKTLKSVSAESKIELLDMKEYIKSFCKQHNVNLKFDKFPIQLFLD